MSGSDVRMNGSSLYACKCRGQALSRWVEHMDMGALSRRTIGERERIVRAISRDLAVPDCAMSPDLLRAWLRTVRNPSSRSTYYHALRAWSHYLVREGYRDDDPTIRVARPKVPRAQPRPVLTMDVRRLLASGQHPQTIAQATLCACAGLRVSEAAKVSGEDFRRVADLFEVVGKGGGRDYLPLNDDLRRLIDQWPSSGSWFPSPGDPSRHVSPNSVSAGISRAFRRIGVAATAHQLRHWFGTTLLQEGVPVRVVQELMRHRSLATTAIYTGVGQEERQGAMNLLPSVTVLTSSRLYEGRV